MFIVLKNAKKYSSTRIRLQHQLLVLNNFKSCVLALVLDNFKSCVLVLVLEACALESSTVKQKNATSKSQHQQPKYSAKEQLISRRFRSHF